MLRAATALSVTLLLGFAPPTEADAQAPPPATSFAWCAEELEELADGLCVASPEKESSPRTLVIFLHGVIKDGTDWQWAQERAMATAAKRNGFVALLPRGRLGVASKKWDGHWTWPTSVEGQRIAEDEILAEWADARKKLEERAGKPFEHVYVMGFSAGAYYAASLALRGKLEVDGYAVYAGGSAPKPIRKNTIQRANRPPIYVGYGERDKAKKDPQKLADALRALGWKHKLVPRRRVGHTMTQAQIDEALAFLGRTKKK